MNKVSSIADQQCSLPYNTAASGLTLEIYKGKLKKEQCKGVGRKKDGGERRESRHILYLADEAKQPLLLRLLFAREFSSVATEKKQTRGFALFCKH